MATIGKTTICYHRTKPGNLESLLMNKFIPGGGDAYGPGLYSTYELKYQGKSYMDMYGEYLIMYETVIGKSTLITVPEIAKGVYQGMVNLTKKDAQQYIGQDSGTVPRWHLIGQLYTIFKGPPKVSQHVKDLCFQWTSRLKDMKSDVTISADFAMSLCGAGSADNLRASIASGMSPIDSIIYHGKNDGGCLVTFNCDIIKPKAWAEATYKDVASGKVRWIPVEHDSKMFKKVRLNMLVKNILTDATRGQLEGIEMEPDLDFADKVNIVTAKSLIEAGLEDSKDPLAAKRILKLLSFGLINISMRINRDPMFFFLIDFLSPDVLNAYFKMHGMVPATNSFGQPAIEYLIENYPTDQRVTAVIDVIMKRPEFNPNARTRIGEPLFLFCARKNFIGIGLELIAHPDFDNSVAGIPTVMNESGNKMAFSSYYAYLTYIKDNEDCEEKYQFKNLPAPILAKFKPTGYDVAIDTTKLKGRITPGEVAKYYLSKSKGKKKSGLSVIDRLIHGSKTADAASPEDELATET